ncbi:MAG: hypothetical protein HZA64_13235 [Rhodocyclales bacterium]|nr:hypothetical protein [Rhodocyclales bacterium]
MRHFPQIRTGLTLLALVSTLAAGPAFADKPSWAGGGKQEDRYDRRDDRRDESRHESRHRDDRRWDDRRRDDYWSSRGHRFHDDIRVRIDVYYDREFRRGHCPPGLRKKGPGCVPPGHVRKWQRGRPLPREVVYAPLPHELLIQLPPPPLHHEYVRVASDILLIAVGTAMVVDAIEDIGRVR